MLTIKEITSKTSWETFLTKKEIVYYPFFQSWNWGEVQKMLGFDILRLGLFDGSKLVGVCLTVDVKAKRGHYLHLRHGPVIIENLEKFFDVLIHHNKKIALEKGASFLRMSPLVLKDEALDNMLKQQGAVKAPIHNMDAQICWVLDITKSEEQLLKEMRKTHRYLIRKAKEMDIEILRTKNDSDITSFLSIYNDLSKRKGFVPHSGIREEFEQFSKEDQSVLFLAKFNKQIISGALIDFVGNEAIYRHGASVPKFHNVPSSYLMQWEAIKEAKKRGKTLYNFWGIAPSEQKNHPWKGLTLFKTGFGGKKVEFVHAYDFPLNKIYWKTYAIDWFTKWRKGY